PYFRGKALVEYALAQSGVPYSIVRPTWIFGGAQDILTNNIAWVLRRMPAFALPGDGRYPVQPVHVDDVARICVEAAQFERDEVVDAAGPETMAFDELVALVRELIAARSRIAHVPPRAMAVVARALGAIVHDVVLTRDEIAGLMQGLLVSNEPPRGTIAFSEWLREHRASVGRSYANELDRHFAVAATR
ncbi:MAG TPA: NAD-dependent epimerase/dehydratase family protein, partial [Solirubrobacteraceae bacterium]|nr:NAD-dependent epimerase/dehydratase family protein [Solirubrobacteraceae bacterium]